MNKLGLLPSLLVWGGGPWLSTTSLASFSAELSRPGATVDRTEQLFLVLSRHSAMSVVAWNPLLCSMRVVLSPHFKDEEKQAQRG